MKRITISASRSYDICIGSGLLSGMQTVSLWRTEMSF